MPEAPTMPSGPAQVSAAPSAPQSQAPQAPPPSGGNDLMAGIQGAVEAARNPQKAAAQPAAKPQAKPAAKVDPAKPTAATTDKPAATNPWDTEATPAEEPATETPEAETPPAEVKSPEAKARWGELKSKAAELEKILPEYTALKEKLAQMEATPNKLAPEVESELNDLRQFKAAYAIEDTPEFQEAVRKPYAKQESLINEVAEYAGIDVDALFKATDEPNPLRRVQAIKKVLSASEVDLDEQAVSIVTNAANVLHETVYPKQAELRAKALEIQNAVKGQQEMQTAQQRAEQEKKMGESMTQMFTTLESKLKPTGLFDNAELATKLKEAKLENPSEAPLKAAYQAQAAVLLPAFITKYNEVMTQLKEAKAALKARGSATAGPSNAGEAPKQATNEYDGGMSLQDQLSQVVGRR